MIDVHGDYRFKEESLNPSNPRPCKRRGFGSIDPAKQKELASKGGIAAHKKGTAHEFNAEEARAAGRKGGVAVSKNREHMANIGRKGGQNKGKNQKAPSLEQTHSLRDTKSMNSFEGENGG